MARSAEACASENVFVRRRLHEALHEGSLQDARHKTCYGDDFGLQPHSCPQVARHTRRHHGDNSIVLEDIPEEHMSPRVRDAQHKPRHKRDLGLDHMARKQSPIVLDGIAQDHLSPMLLTARHRRLDQVDCGLCKRAHKEKPIIFEDIPRELLSHRCTLRSPRRRRKSGSEINTMRTLGEPPSTTATLYKSTSMPSPQSLRFDLDDCEETLRNCQQPKEQPRAACSASSESTLAWQQAEVRARLDGLCGQSNKQVETNREFNQADETVTNSPELSLLDPWSPAAVQKTRQAGRPIQIHRTLRECWVCSD